MSAHDVGDAGSGPAALSTDELVAVLELVPEPVFVMRPVRDPDGAVVDLRYAYLNEASALGMGKPVAPMVGRGLCEVFTSARELGFFDAFVGAIDSGKPVTFELPWIEENGLAGSFDLTATPFGEGVMVVARETTAQRKAEAGLAESLKRYQLIAENASDVVLLLGPDQRVQWASPGLTNTLGWAPEELIGRVVTELGHPDDVTATAAPRDAVFAGEDVAAPEGGVLGRVQTKSGRYLWMSAATRPLMDESGDFTGVVFGLRNVDELVQAREAAHADRAYLHAALSSLLDPHVLLVAVRDETAQIVDFTYADANPAALAANHAEYQELVGARVLARLPGHAESGLFDLYREVVETGEPLVLDDFAYAQELMGDEQRRYDLRGARVGDGLSFSWRDVTDRHDAALRLAESEDQYRLLAENAADMVMRLSPARIFEWVCIQVGDVVGWAPSDLVGRPFDDFIHPADVARFRKQVDDAGLPGAVIVELRFRRVPAVLP